MAWCELRLKASGQSSFSSFFLNSLLKDVAGPQAFQQHAEVPLFLVFNGRQLSLPLALIKGFFDPEGWAGALIVLREPPAMEELTWHAYSKTAACSFSFMAKISKKSHTAVVPSGN